MKSNAKQAMSGLFVSLLMATSGVHAKSIDPTEPIKKGRSFEVKLYVDTRKKINLLLALCRPQRVTILLKDDKQTVLHQESVKSNAHNFSQKFDFEEAKTGTYQFEVTDGQQTIVQRIEVIDIEPQRLITYGQPSSL